MKLWSETLQGNLHEATATINNPKFWVQWRSIVAMQYTGGSLSVVVFEIEEEEYERLLIAQRRTA